MRVSRRQPPRRSTPTEVLSFARALIAAPSENPGGTEDEAAEVATDILTGDRRVARDDPGRRGPAERRRLDRLGDHVPRSPGTDTWMSSPWATSTNWLHGPWEGAVEDGRLIGRGSADMKGPVASALAAAAAHPSRGDRAGRGR